MELDFVNQATGQPYDNILLAGENGTGKTSILTALSGFLNGYSIEYFEYIEYVSGDQILKAVPPSFQSDVSNGFYDMIEADSTITHMRTEKNDNGGSTINDTIDNNPLNIRFSGCVLSKARADFQTKAITTTTIKQLDEVNKDLDDKEDFTSLKQLIVDIDSQDNSEYARINRDAGDAPLK
jgi:AAA15 family ATPase/GTPase